MFQRVRCCPMLVSLGCLTFVACGGEIGNGESDATSLQTGEAETSVSGADVTVADVDPMVSGDESTAGATASEGSAPATSVETEPPASQELVADDAASDAAQADVASTDPSSMPSADDAAPLTGEELFAAQCGACHGEAGVGSALAPEIQHPTPDFFSWIVRNGREGAYDVPMLAYTQDNLSDVELEAILGYLTQLPQPTTDEGLYVDYCANCHGADGRGGTVNKNIAGKDEFLEVVRQGKGGTDYAARTRYMPGWTGSEMTTDLIEQIQGFVGALPE